MIDEERLANLLLAWEEQFKQGNDIPCERLCEDAPDLLEPFAKRVAALKRMNWLDNIGRDHSAPSCHRDDLPGDAFYEEASGDPRLAVELLLRWEELYEQGQVAPDAWFSQDVKKGVDRGNATPLDNSMMAAFREVVKASDIGLDLRFRCGTNIETLIASLTSILPSMPDGFNRMSIAIPDRVQNAPLGNTTLEMFGIRKGYKCFFGTRRDFDSCGLTSLRIEAERTMNDRKESQLNPRSTTR